MGKALEKSEEERENGEYSHVDFSENAEEVFDSYGDSKENL